MRSVLITGTSTGIGQTTAVALAARGWHVFATMRNLDKRSLLEQALTKAGVQNELEIERLDVTDAASIRAAVASILARTGNRLHAVVHNAGVAAAGALEDVPESELRQVMETNFFGVLELTHTLSRPSARKGRGGSSSSRARPPSSANPQTRSTARRNGPSRDGPRRSLTSLSPSGLTLFSSSPAPTALRFGRARPDFSRRTVLIVHGCSRSFTQAMRTPPAWRAIRRRWLL
jgi:NAD(P)-dependent dehydrogenase (short-subunit alcohol dehydrogenase family)